MRGHPRHRCRGLIEVGFRRVTIAESREVIRGIDAAASLKLCSDHHGDRYGADVIRGIDAAASLKPVRTGEHQALGLARHPRHRCRGLIEASKPPEERYVKSVASRADACPITSE
jgi:hypothetical protein